VCDSCQPLLLVPAPAAVGSWGPAIVGHANDEVNAALKAQIDKGTSFGAPCELEVGLGNAHCTALPGSRVA
jgi:glutamate-1-semialdehyde 2,1-aminomutase